MSSPIEILRYVSLEHFRADASAMTEAGWDIVAQSEATSGVRGAWIGVAFLLMLGSLLAWWLLIGSALAVVAAFVDRRRLTVVAYRPRSLR